MNMPWRVLGTIAALLAVVALPGASGQGTSVRRNRVALTVDDLPVHGPLPAGVSRVQVVQTTAAVRFPPPDVPERNDILLYNRVPIPMRDGVSLYADVYRPVGNQRYPVIVSRTPYSTERFPSAYEAGVYFSRRGYVYVFQDVRGRHESDGRWEPFFDDERDGYDTVEWAARQPWSNGKVGMQGGSYLGQNQWRAAQAAPPSLVTIFPSVASTSIYHDWITLNGAWRLSFNFGWGPVRQESRIMQNPGAAIGALVIAALDECHGSINGALRAVSVVDRNAQPAERISEGHSVLLPRVR